MNQKAKLSLNHGSCLKSTLNFTLPLPKLTWPCLGEPKCCKLITFLADEETSRDVNWSISCEIRKEKQITWPSASSAKNGGKPLITSLFSCDKERLRLYKRWPCSTYILNRISWRECSVTWSAIFLSHMNHVSVSPTDGTGPTQGQRKTLTRVGIEPTTFGLDLRRSTDWTTRSGLASCLLFIQSFADTHGNCLKNTM